MRASRTVRLHAALFVVLWAVPAGAQEAPEEARAKVAHGSRSGAGDSRGPGAGDGRGRGEQGAQRAAADAATGEEHKGDKKKDDGLLGFDVGEDVRIVPRLQYRVRYYHDDGRDFRDGGANDYVRHRARVGLEAHYRDWLSAAVHVQDVRTWGEELSPNNDVAADGFDLFAGYLRVGTADETLNLTIGRQPLVYGNHRLMGPGDFGEHGRSFDAIRLSGQRGGATYDAAWALVRDYDTNPGPGPRFGKAHLGVLELGYRIVRELEPHAIVVFEGDTTRDQALVTAGPLFTGVIGDEMQLQWSAEGYLQAGGEDPSPPADEVNYFATLFALQTRVTWNRGPKPYLALEGTLISGDEDPGDSTIETFRSPHPSGHRYHGEMDLFVSFPRDTQERGLRDIGAALGMAPMNTDVRVTFHLFQASADRDALRHFGWEMDFALNGRYLDDHLGVGAVYAFFVPGDLIALEHPDPGIEQRAFVTADAKF